MEQSREGGERLQVRNSVYISPVEATTDCSVIHTDRQTQKHTYTHFISTHTLCTLSAISDTQTQRFTQKAGGKAHQYTSPVLCLSHSLPHHHFVYDYTFKSRPY